MTSRSLASLRAGGRCQPQLWETAWSSPALSAYTTSRAQARIAAFHQGLALLIANHPLFTTGREHIIALAARYAMPTMYVQREFASAGGLVTYGTDLPEVYRLTGGYTE